MTGREYTPREFRSLWPEFQAESWAGWASIEDACFGVEPADPDLVQQVTGRTELPSDPVSEVWAVVGRGGGKSRWCARLAVFFAAGRTYKRVPGENIFVGVFGPDRRQANLTFKYISGLLHAVPALERLIVSEKTGKDSASIELSNGVVVEVVTSSRAAPRGRAYALAIVEEAAFLPHDSSTDPDTELLRAVRPGLARVPGSLLAVVSSPYARRGELYKTWKAKFGKADPHTLVVQASTLDLNPSFDAGEIARALEEDEAGATAEYLAEFRKDIESFVSREAVEAVTVPGRLELPPLGKVDGRAPTYHAFADPSGGSGADSFALAVGHAETRDGISVAVVDCIRETRPPYSPEQVTAEFSELLATYGITKIQGDRYAGDWPKEAFQRHGITYEPAPKPKSDLYRDSLALINGGRVELPDLDRLTAQLVTLERRTARGGRDSIDHPPGGHDDLANVVCGLAVLLTVDRKSKRAATWRGGRRGATEKTTNKRRRRRRPTRSPMNVDRTRLLLTPDGPVRVGEHDRLTASGIREDRSHERYERRR